MSQGILYISYDGMMEPLGQSQVLAYLEKLAPDRRIHLISYEKADDWKDAKRRTLAAARIADAGIEWHPLRYHKMPTAPATAYDIAVGTAQAVALVRRHKLRIVHARSYVAALIGLAVKRTTGVKLLFDLRGLWADERVDGGIWQAGGRLYRMVKALERKFLLAADHVVTLTHASAAEIRNFDYLRGKAPPISVIPTCADLQRFSIQGPPPREPFTLGYVGSVGTWYLLDDMLECFSMLRQIRPRARLLIVNRKEQQTIRDRATALDIDPTSIDVVAAEHRDVPRLIGRMSAGLAFYKPGYSRIACAPTKLAEYLGCGVPCLGNSGVGDMADILETRRVGVALPGFADDQMREGVDRLLQLVDEPDLAQRCRAVAEEQFSLDGGVSAYAAIYRELLATPSAEKHLAGQH